MKRLSESRSYRQEHGEFLCDGMKLLEEAVSSGAVVTAVLTTLPLPFELNSQTTVYRVGRDLIESLSPLRSAQDTLFTCKIPPLQELSDLSGTHILLDGMQDPGNVGAIIRTACAFGIQSVILTDGCADPYNPKTLRASMGAVFRQKLYFVSVPDFAAALEKANTVKDPGLSSSSEKDFRVIGAAPRGDSAEISVVSLTNCVIAIGNEGHGLSKQVLALCDETVSIPIAPECQSLNAAVAAAIFIWEAARQAGTNTRI